ncbi:MULTISPECIES: hypothetical protein [Rhizobium/Agrobacterium group]|uniref:Uncharacterized protein n=1 Tax=Agrobacterium tomkonis CFBP 6623 TaxID=1183432 RepID=A0A1S7S6B0_9HYPH|nr:MULTISPECIES: hypothetical protein [Rhizobium/Agrobacterium group]MCZ7487176.1 hypothetical protein [Rhizobium rhizogenes]QCL90858.1 hypothetical protein CFBP6623_16660 [Agrobacterium tumefaciens]CUX63389.1 conserved membrane hypothetical protein [Agrobacterium tomkonis CFBP 6623]
MSETNIAQRYNADAVWYEEKIPIRGNHFKLSDVKFSYRELQQLNAREGASIIGKLVKLENESDEAFVSRKDFLLKDAFRVTVSIIGFEGQTVYGETQDVFDADDVPFPIKAVYFTNLTAFKRNANGNKPSNFFSVTLTFDKPPLFDPNPLVSDPTPNESEAVLECQDVTFFRAAQTIVRQRLNSKRRWYSFIHAKFTYDIGLWLCAFPYALYWIAVYAEYFFPEDRPNWSYRIAFFIYSIGISLFAYRALFGYVKWAFPVNRLEENKDAATANRIVLGAIFSSLFLTALASVLGIS